jgi:hypothetical protein
MVWRTLVVAAFLVLLAIVVSAGTCGEGGDQYRELGRGMGEMVREGGVPGSYMYVADIEAKLYWPNQPQYADAIPAERRVYIKDTETLKEFKGYQPGPL